ncbi:anthranilate synthase component I [Mariniblastus sp.]|jgi:anthranilate synthase component I|nr:anthranilate synthase component I [Mariniblastus sp.]
MAFFPDQKTFTEMAGDYDAIPISRRLLSDSLTPVSAFRRIDNGSTACLFESVIGGENVGRYSFLAIDPQVQVASFGKRVTLTEAGSSNSYECENPLEEIRRRINLYKVAQFPDMPPFTGGAVGYAGYDVVRYVEDLPNAPADDRDLPDMSFAFYDRMLVFDHITKTITVVALAWTKKHENLDAAFEDANRRIDEMLDCLNRPETDLLCLDADLPTGEPPEFSSNFTQEQFEQAVLDCIEYIRAGDIFQVVLSQRLQIEINCDPFEIYRSLRVMNPSPFMFFLRTDETTLVGSSPEIMCRVVDNEMTVRPLAGTRKRGSTPQEDLELEQELLADEKELAEHVMLVDLGRNDVGRVAQYGSIEIPDRMVVERYSHVMHISSTVTGQLQESADAFDALMASLPAGTVSGAPKVRAMEIIDQFEPHRRGPYAGAVGYIDYSDNMDTCIALRTMVIKDNVAYVQAGAGIVADSNPTSEYEETLNKARGLLRAIQMTHERVQASS